MVIARAEFNPGEIDHDFQIAAEIRNTLRTAPTATVSATVILAGYDCYDEDGNVIESTREQKCDEIAKETDVEFSIRGDSMDFRPTQPR